MLVCVCLPCVCVFVFVFVFVFVCVTGLDPHPITGPCVHLGQVYYKDAFGALLVFDLSKPDTFASVIKVVECWHFHQPPPRPPPLSLCLHFLLICLSRTSLSCAAQARD